MAKSADRPRRSPAATVPGLLLDDQLCFSLYSASRAMARAYRPLLDPLGLTYPQYLVLMVLWQGDGVPVSSIGEALQLDTATLTPLLKRMQGAGLIDRTRSAQDERQVLVTLTRAGRALKARAKGVPIAITAATGCGVDALGRLKTRLDALRDTLLARD